MSKAMDAAGDQPCGFSSPANRQSLDVWTLPMVDGELTFATWGDIVLVHANDPQKEQVFVDTLFSREAVGQPIELTWEQVISLRDFLTQRIEARGKS